MMQVGGYYHFIVARECMVWKRSGVITSILSYLTRQRKLQYFYTTADKHKITNIYIGFTYNQTGSCLIFFCGGGT